MRQFNTMHISVFKMKALIPLALDGTDIGKTRAGRALAKIAISINPEHAFPGQRVNNIFFYISSVY